MKKALIIVDMQYDFISGALAVPGAHDIILPIQEYMCQASDLGSVVVLTADAHPEDHKSFITNGGPWPVHCLVGTHGGDIQVGILSIALIEEFPIFEKGTKADEEGYSGFDNEELDPYLKSFDVTEIEICGLARNYCVQATVEAAEALGYKVTVLEHLCQAV